LNFIFKIYENPTDFIYFKDYLLYLYSLKNKLKKK